MRFADGIATLTGEAKPLLLEIGAGNALSTLALQATRGRGIRAVSSLPDAARSRPDREHLLETAGRLWLAGIETDWSALHATPRSRVSLPTYPFQRRRCWIDAPTPVARAATTTDFNEGRSAGHAQDVAVMNDSGSITPPPQADAHLQAMRGPAFWSWALIRCS